MKRLLVFFATGHGHTLIGRLTNGLIRLSSGSGLCHVYVGDEDSVTAHGRRWPTQTFIERYPNLTSMVVVPCSRAVVVDGRLCVRRAVRCLRLSGVPVPRYLWSPYLLKQYLLEAGYTVIALSGDSEC